MADQSNTASAPPSPAPTRWGRGTIFGLALLAVAVVAGLTGNMLTTAFGQGMAWRAWHNGAFMSGPLTQAQIDDRIDRMTKHMAIELDATSDQQMKIAAIAKTAVADLLPLRDKAQAARGQAVALLTAPTVDRSALERLRSEQIALAETASKRLTQALADATEVLTPDQRRKVADWITFMHAAGPWAPWRRG
jgi:protein CpxP